MKIAKLATVFSLIMLPIFSEAQDNEFLKKYAGTYHMLAFDQPETATPDKYVFTADGKCEWTMTFQNNDGKKELKKTYGTWTASEGLISMNFNMGGGEGSELLSDYRWDNGVFRNTEGVYLKKIETKKAPAATPKKTLKPAIKKN